MSNKRISKLALIHLCDFEYEEGEEAFPIEDAYTCSLETNEDQDHDHDHDDYVEIYEDEKTGEISCQQIDEIVEELKETFDHTTEEANAIKDLIIKKLFTHNY